MKARIKGPGSRRVMVQDEGAVAIEATRGGTSREDFAAQVWKWRISALLISVCPELSCMTVLSPEEAEHHSLNAQVKAAAAMMSS